MQLLSSVSSECVPQCRKYGGGRTFERAHVENGHSYWIELRQLRKRFGSHRRKPRSKIRRLVPQTGTVAGAHCWPRYISPVVLYAGNVESRFRLAGASSCCMTAGDFSEITTKTEPPEALQCPTPRSRPTVKYLSHVLDNIEAQRFKLRRQEIRLPRRPARLYLAHRRGRRGKQLPTLPPTHR